MLVLHAEVPCYAKAQILTRQQVEILLLPITSNALSPWSRRSLSQFPFLLKSTGKNTADCSNALPFESNLKTHLTHFTEETGAFQFYLKPESPPDLWFQTCQEPKESDRYLEGNIRPLTSATNITSKKKKTQILKISLSPTEENFFPPVISLWCDTWDCISHIV